MVSLEGIRDGEIAQVGEIDRYWGRRKRKHGLWDRYIKYKCLEERGGEENIIYMRPGNV